MLTIFTCHPSTSRMVRLFFECHRGHQGCSEVWESITPTRAATQLCSYPQLKGPQKICGFGVQSQNPALKAIFTKKPPNFTTKSPKPDPPPQSYERNPQTLPKQNQMISNVTPAPSSYQKKTAQILPQNTPNLTQKTQTFLEGFGKIWGGGSLVQIGKKWGVLFGKENKGVFGTHHLHVVRPS